MEQLKNNDWVLYHGKAGKIEIILDDIIIANIDGEKIKDRFDNFTKINIKDKDSFTINDIQVVADKILNYDYLKEKYKKFDDTDITVLQASGTLLIHLLKEELNNDKFV